MENAESLLSFYFRTLFEKAGLEWTRDNDSEMEEIVKHLMEEADDNAVITLRQYGLIN